MSRTQSTSYNLQKDHGSSEIISEHIDTTTERIKHGEIDGFPWQFVAVIAVIVIGVLVVVLKGAGLF